MAPPAGAKAPELPIRVRIHDASRFEWTTVIALPDHGGRPYTIEVEFELPANAASWSTPWEQLQTFTRLDGASGVLPSADATIDTLRRATVATTQLFRQARQGFERHCRSAAGGKDAMEEGHTQGISHDLAQRRPSRGARSAHEAHAADCARHSAQHAREGAHRRVRERAAPRDARGRRPSAAGGEWEPLRAGSRTRGRRRSSFAQRGHAKRVCVSHEPPVRERRRRVSGVAGALRGAYRAAREAFRRATLSRSRD